MTRGNFLNFRLLFAPGGTCILYLYLYGYYLMEGKEISGLCFALHRLSVKTANLKKELWSCCCWLSCGVPDTASAMEIVIFGGLLCFSISKSDPFLLVWECAVLLFIFPITRLKVLMIVALKADVRFQGPTWL